MVQKSGRENHRLDGAKTPGKSWDKLPTSTGAVFLNHQQQQYFLMNKNLGLDVFLKEGGRIPTKTLAWRPGKNSQSRFPTQNRKQPPLFEKKNGPRFWQDRPALFGKKTPHGFWEKRPALFGKKRPPLLRKSTTVFGGKGVPTMCFVMLNHYMYLTVAVMNSQKIKHLLTWNDLHLLSTSRKPTVDLYNEKNTKWSWIITCIRCRYNTYTEICTHIHTYVQSIYSYSKDCQPCLQDTSAQFTIWINTRSRLTVDEPTLGKWCNSDAAASSIATF